jgi:hypothetical protein
LDVRLLMAFFTAGGRNPLQRENKDEANHERIYSGLIGLYLVLIQGDSPHDYKF